MSYLDDLFSVRGKTALVTGGATGIGRMIATALVKAGADVLIASRKGADCERVAGRTERARRAARRKALPATSSTEAGIAALVEAVKARTDKLHILMNNAGAAWGEPLKTFPYKAWAKVLDVNVTAVFHLTRELLPLLEKRRERRRPRPRHQSRLGDGHPADRPRAIIPTRPRRPRCITSRARWRWSLRRAASPSTPSRPAPSRAA